MPKALAIISCVESKRVRDLRAPLVMKARKVLVPMFLDLPANSLYLRGVDLAILYHVLIVEHLRWHCFVCLCGASCRSQKNEHERTKRENLSHRRSPTFASCNACRARYRKPFFRANKTSINGSYRIEYNDPMVKRIDVDIRRPKSHSRKTAKRLAAKAAMLAARKS
jgi:hypothetical protein